MLVIQACSVIIYIFEGYIIQKNKKKKKNKKINEKFFFWCYEYIIFDNWLYLKSVFNNKGRYSNIYTKNKNQY